MDDMSELDIQLQEQTSDVSVTEMLKEASNLQVFLGENQKENEKGDEHNVK